MIDSRSRNPDIPLVTVAIRNHPRHKKALTMEARREEQESTECTLYLLVLLHTILATLILFALVPQWFSNHALSSISIIHLYPQKIQDWQLFVVVLVLVVVDLIILGTYTGIEGRKDNLSATRLVNKENPEDEKGVSIVIHVIITLLLWTLGMDYGFFSLQDLGVVYKYYFYTCTSEARSITLGVLYGYKAVLQVVSLLFAFQIRKVKVKGVNDAKYIAAAIYITSIILVVTILSTYTLVDYVNGYVAVFGLGLLMGNTAIVALVFLPKVG